MNKHIVRIIFDDETMPNMRKLTNFVVKQRRSNKLIGFWMVLTVLYLFNEAKYNNEQDKEIAKLQEEIEQLKGEQIMR